MGITKLSCAACGAPIVVPEDVVHFQCPYCSTTLEVKRDQNHVALNLGRQIRQSIEQVGEKTQSAIADSSQATQTELKRLQLNQQILTLNMQLSNIQAEMRGLYREEQTRKIKEQLTYLRRQEGNLIQQINDTQASLIAQNTQTTSKGEPQRSDHGTTAASVSPKSWLGAYLLCLFGGVFGLHRFYTGHKLLGFLQLFTAGGFVIWWFIDLFSIARGTYKDGNGNLLIGPQTIISKIVVIGFSTLWALYFTFALAGLDPEQAVKTLLGGMALVAVMGVVVYFVLAAKNKAKPLS